MRVKERQPQARGTTARTTHRIHRILRIIRLLHLRRLRSVAEVAAECRVSRRTAFRDLAAIEKAGFTIWYDRAAAGYRIHPRDFIPPQNLDPLEAADLMVAASALGGDHGIPLLEGAREALTKLEAALPLSVRTQACTGTQTTEVLLGPTSHHRGLKAVYELVRQAIRQSERLQCRYISLGGAAQIRFSLDPYWLVFHRHAWYVIGRSSRDCDVRPFKLGRFKNITRAGQAFRRPEGYALRDYLGNAWGIVPGKERYEVRLRFSPLMGPYVAEINWHKTQRLSWDDDGRVLFSVTVDGLDEIAWWIHGFGAHVEILDPPVLRARVAEISAPPAESLTMGLCDI